MGFGGWREIKTRYEKRERKTSDNTWITFLLPDFYNTTRREAKRKPLVMDGPKSYIVAAFIMAIFFFVGQLACDRISEAPSTVGYVACQ